jgi:membrane protease YdiL (CAAX protease family)
MSSDPTDEAPTTDGPGAADRTRRRAVWDLAAYVALTFTITWGISAILLTFPQQVQAIIGPAQKLKTSWPIFVAVWAPTISAVVVSLAFGGLTSLRALAARAVRPASAVWIATAILGLPAALLALGLAERVAAPAAQHFVDLRALAFGAPTLLLASVASLAVVANGGLGEEAGWRGFALPRLIQLMGPLPAALTLGVVWGAWHLPLFLGQGGLAQSNFGLFLVSAVAMTVFMTWIYLHANGNFLIAGVIPHLVANLIGDAHVLARDPNSVLAGVICAVAAIVVLAYGPSLQGRRRRVGQSRHEG